MAELKKKRLAKPIQNILEGEFLSRESVVRNLPFLIFLALIAIVYIANTYYAEKTSKEIEATKLELKELRYQYITTKSNLMFLSKQTEVSKRGQLMGLKETTVPPFKIFYSTQEINPGSKK
ncbi:MAG: FtsL-like putative cell division protein [bacterium]